MLSQLGKTVSLDSQTNPTKFVVPSLSLGEIADSTYSFTFTVSQRGSSTLTALQSF